MKVARRWAGLAIAVWAGPAAAHSPVPGIEGFYVGLLHPYSTPSQVLVILGLGLVVGGYVPDRAQWVLLCFLLASLIGLVFAFGFQNLDSLLFAVAFAACALAALAPAQWLPAAMALTGLGGFLIGDASVPDDGPMRDRLFTMSGSIVGANVGLLYLFGICLFVRERYTQNWVGVAFRVAAAWLGAISLLMLALAFVDVAPEQ